MPGVAVDKPPESGPSMWSPVGRMSAFRPFEREVVEILVRPYLPEDRVAEVLEAAEPMSCVHTGSGYYFTVRHPSLPRRRIVCHDPVVLGRCDEVQCGFVVFLEDARLTLECHTWGAVEVPAGFRECEVEIDVAR
jgi:hypothetical protein